jgi:hypothetical protein
VITLDQLCKLLRASRAAEFSIDDAHADMDRGYPDPERPMDCPARASIELDAMLAEHPCLESDPPTSTDLNMHAEAMERIAILVLCSAHAYRCAAFRAMHGAEHPLPASLDSNAAKGGAA